MKKYLITILLLLGITTTAYSAGNIRNSSVKSDINSTLVAWRTMDGKDINNGTIRDMSGNGHTLQLSNIASSTFYSSGVIGQAGKFDGINDFAYSDDTSLLRPASFTLSAWFYCSSFASAHTIISKPRMSAPW